MKNSSIKLNSKLLAWLLVLIIALLWGLAWVYMKAVLAYMGAFTFTAFRFSIGAITLLLISWGMKYGLPEKRYWKHLALVGLMQTSAMFLLVMYGLTMVEAGKSSVLLYSMPLWSSLLAMKYLQEKLILRQLAGLFIGMIGIRTILGWDIWVEQNVHIIVGELLIVLAAVIWAISNVYYRLHLSELPKIQANTYQMTFGSIAICLVAAFTEWGEPIIWTPASIYYVAFTGVLASALCFTVWYIVLSMIDMVTATIATLLVPILDSSSAASCSEK